MIRTATIHRIAGLATGGLLLAISLANSSAKAAPICTNGLLISTIASTGPSGYTCQSGSLEYTFANDLGELVTSSPNSFINFNNTSSSQKIIFSNLAFEGLFAFSYTISSISSGISYNVTAIDQSYTQDLPSPPPLDNSITASLPSTFVNVAAILETDASSGPPNPKLTSLTHNITLEPVPGPLPVVGTTVALGFSRKLRRRLEQAKRPSGLNNKA